jgi:very-short-patch-repair endonuclease
MGRMKFRRQQPIGRFIVDFICFEKKVIVEVDGGQHSEEVDGARDQWLVKQGFRVLRFWNNDVLQNTEGVFEVIRDTCSSTLP